MLYIINDGSNLFGIVFAVSFFSRVRFLVQGCSSPMVVKFADTQKEKDQKRIHQATASLWGGIGGMGNLTPQYLTVSGFFFFFN